MVCVKKQATTVYYYALLGVQYKAVYQDSIGLVYKFVAGSWVLCRVI